LKVSSERLEGCLVALTVEIEPEEMEKAQEGAYRRLVKKVAVPGFRKGKAPRALLELHIGKGSFDAEALDRLVPELYDQAIEQEKVIAIGQPDLEMTQADPPIFKATVPVRPEVELGDYHSIKVTKDKVEITDEDVEQGIDNLRQMQATHEPVERDAGLNDIVIIDVEGIVEEKTVLDSKESQYRITENSVMPVAGFADQIQGMKAGDQKEFTLPFPEDHASEELAGKDCLFKVSMSDVKEEKLPEVDDEFAKSMGQGIETVEQLKEKLRENITTAAERDSQSKLENEVIDGIAAISKVEFPAIFTEQEIDRLGNEQMMRLGGMQVQDFLKYRGITEEDFRNELRPAAEKRVMSSLILNKVHDTENVEVDEAEIDSEIDKIVEEAGEEQAEAIKKMFETAEARESIRGRLLTEKTINLLIDIATTDEVAPVEEAVPEQEVVEEVTQEEGQSEQSPTEEDSE